MPARHCAHPLPCRIGTVPPAPPAHPPARGRTLLELLCVLAITAVLCGGALPLFGALATDQRLRATAALLETDIHLARSTAVHDRVPVRLAVLATDAGGSCYLLYTGTAAGCTCGPGDQAHCQPGARLLRAEHQRGGVVLLPLPHTLVFSGQKATVTPTATLRVQAGDGRSIHQVVNIMGRVRSCSPGGRVSGLPACG